MNCHSPDTPPRDSGQQRTVGMPGEQGWSRRTGRVLALVAAVGLAAALAMAFSLVTVVTNSLRLCRVKV